MPVPIARAAARMTAVLALVLSTALSFAQPATPLPTDPAIVSGELGSGLRYMVRKHETPPKRAAVWLHISTGSLNETDQQRGIAHYLEHMAFNGSEHFPPNSVIGFFQSLGLTFGQHQNAFTSFDQTVYQLDLPDNKPETLDKAMSFMSDVALRLSLLPAEIDEERQIILEERRTRLSGHQRVQDYFLENVLPGSIFGERIPIGTAESIQSLAPQDFQAYYRKWYIPSNMTVMVVADMDTSAAIESIKKNFGEGPRKPKPAPQDIGVKPYDAPRAIVASDTELTDAEISVIWVQKPLPPTTTKELLRARIVDGAGQWIFNRRLQQRVLEGKAAYHSASATADDFFHAATLISAEASGEPAKWKAMLAEVSTELRRAALHGFGEQELADAKKALISAAEREVQVEATRSAGALLGEMNSAVTSNEPILTAQQGLDLNRELVPTLTVAEVSARFKELFDTARPATFSLTLPASAEVPTEKQLTELGVEAMKATPEEEAVAARPTELLPAGKLPAPGKIAESTEHEATGVTSAWLDNGVRVHYRHMDYKKDSATITITLAGGAILETPADHGISQAAAIAWRRPATTTLTSTNIRDLMTGRKATAGGGAGNDTMTIGVSGSPAELETAMQLAYLMLTDPVVEPAGLEQWKEQQKQGTRMRKMAPEGVLSDLAAQTIFPKSETRVQPLEIEEIDRIDAPTAQAWLRRAIAAAPIEVGVVGDIDKEQAMALVQRYVGSLPKRPRISRETLADLRKVEVPSGPQTVKADLATQTDKAAVLSGFFGADYDKLRDVRLLNMAARILTTRSIEQIREKQQLAYSPQVGSGPAIEFPGHGVVMLITPTAPGKVADLLASAETMFTDFAKDGPTEDELMTARKQIANTLDKDMREPPYWSNQLSVMTYRGRKLDDILAAPGAYQAFTAEEIRECFARYYKPESRFTIQVVPKAKAPEPDDTPATPQRPSEPSVHPVQPGQPPQGPAVDPAPPIPK